MASTLVTKLTHAGQLATVQDLDGTLHTGIWNGKGTAIVSGGKIFFPKD